MTKLILKLILEIIRLIVLIPVTVATLLALVVAGIVIMIIKFMCWVGHESCTVGIREFKEEVLDTFINLELSIDNIKEIVQQIQKK